MLAARSTADIAFRQITSGVMPFIVIMAFYIVLLALFPEIVTWLPGYAQ